MCVVCIVCQGLACVLQRVTASNIGARLRGKYAFVKIFIHHQIMLMHCRLFDGMGVIVMVNGEGESIDAVFTFPPTKMIFDLVTT